MNCFWRTYQRGQLARQCLSAVNEYYTHMHISDTLRTNLYQRLLDPSTLLYCITLKHEKYCYHPLLFPLSGEILNKKLLPAMCCWSELEFSTVVNYCPCIYFRICLTPTPIWMLFDVVTMLGTSKNMSTKLDSDSQNDILDTTTGKCLQSGVWILVKHHRRRPEITRKATCGWRWYPISRMAWNRLITQQFTLKLVNLLIDRWYFCQIKFSISHVSINLFILLLWMKMVIGSWLSTHYL